MFSFTNWQLQFEKGAPPFNDGTALVTTYVYYLTNTLFVSPDQSVLLDSWFTIHILLCKCSGQTAVSRFCIDTHFFTHSVVVGTGCVYSFYPAKHCSSFSSTLLLSLRAGVLYHCFFSKLWNNSKPVQGNPFGFVYISPTINCYNLLWHDNSSTDPIFPTASAFLVPCFSYYCHWWKIKLRSLIIVLSLGKSPLCGQIYKFSFFHPEGRSPASL